VPGSIILHSPRGSPGHDDIPELVLAGLDVHALLPIGQGDDAALVRVLDEVRIDRALTKREPVALDPLVGEDLIAFEFRPLTVSNGRSDPAMRRYVEPAMDVAQLIVTEAAPGSSLMPSPCDPPAAAALT